MSPGFHRNAAPHQAINWLLSLAFLLFTLFPHHYHIHHVEEPALHVHESGHHEHATNMHAHLDREGLEHHSTVVKSTDVSLTTPGVQLPWVVILITFLMLLPLLAQEGRQRLLSVTHRLPRFNRHGTPPLRAPPHA